MLCDNDWTARISKFFLDVEHIGHIEKILNSLGKTEIVIQHDFSSEVSSHDGSSLLTGEWAASITVTGSQHLWLFDLPFQTHLF